MHSPLPCTRVHQRGVTNSHQTFKCHSALVAPVTSKQQVAACTTVRSQKHTIATVSTDSNAERDTVFLLSALPDSVTIISNSQQRLNGSSHYASTMLPHSVNDGHKEHSIPHQQPPPATPSTSSHLPPHQYTTSPTSSAALHLMQAIGKCGTWQELRFLHHQWRSEFNPLHLAAALTRLVKSSQHAAHDPTFLHWLSLLMDSARLQSTALQGRELSTVMWAAAKLGWQPDERWLAAMTARITTTAASLNPQDVATITWSLSHFILPPCPSLPNPTTTLLAASTPLMPHFNAQDLSLMLVGLSRLSVPLPSAWLDACLKEVSIKITSCTPQALCNILHSLRLMRCTPPPMWMDTFLFEATCKAPVFAPRTLASILGSLAALQHPCAPDLLSRLLLPTSHRLPQASSRDLAAILWALATLRHVPPPQWQEAAFHALAARLPSFRSGDMALTLWALSKLQLPPPDWLLQQLASASQRLLPHCTAQDLAQMVRAWGSLRVSPGTPWLQQAASALQQHIGSCQPRELVCVLVGMAQLDHHPPECWALKVLSHLCSRLQSCSSRELLDVGWALGRMQLRPYDAWCERYLAALQPHLPSLRPAQLIQLTWSLHRLKVCADEAFSSELLRALQPQLGCLTWQQLSMASLSAGCLCMKPVAAASWSEAMAQATQSRLRGMDNQCLAGLLRGAAALSCRPPAAWVRKASDAVYHRMQGMSTGSLVSAVASLGALRHQCNGPWLRRLYDVLRPSIAEIPGLQLVRLVGGLAQLRPGRCSAAPDPQWQEACVQRLVDVLGGLGSPDMVRAVEACAQLGWELPEVVVQRVQAASCQDWDQLGADSSLSLLRYAAAVDMRPQRVWMERCLHHYRHHFATLTQQQRVQYLRLLLRVPITAREGYLQRFVRVVGMLTRRLAAEEAAQLRLLLRRLQLQHSCQPG